MVKYRFRQVTTRMELRRQHSRHLAFITSGGKEVMFSTASVCLLVSGIIQRNHSVDLSQNSLETRQMGQGRNDQILTVIARVTFGSWSGLRLLLGRGQSYGYVWVMVRATVTFGSWSGLQLRLGYGQGYGYFWVVVRVTVTFGLWSGLQLRLGRGQGYGDGYG